MEQVRAILRATFPTEAESKLVDALRANGKATISLVAVDGDDVLGHILFSPVTLTPTDATTPLSDAKGIGLAPVAVRPDMQTQGIGSQLIREGLRLCKEQGFDYCVVLGGPKYYRRFGFETASHFDVQNEYGVDEHFMLIRFSDRPIRGLAQYAVEFSMFSV
jgi:putative acetyltransferase